MNVIHLTKREFILIRFMPDISYTDVINGYRADESYFSFTESLLNNTISLRGLNLSMQLDSLSKQVILLSELSFQQTAFIEY